jgi:hypothetical protein
MKTTVTLAVAVAMMTSLGVACAPPPDEDAGQIGSVAQAVSSDDFDVDFSGCSELAAIGTVPAANARPLVPAGYVLAGDATNAVIVVRAVGCSGVSIDGDKPQAAKLAQIGVTLVGPDTTADINNYLLWFATDLGQLHGKLAAAGLDPDNDQGLTYSFTPGGPPGSGTLEVGTSPPHAPPFTAGGPAVVPTAAPVGFTANWWRDGQHGTVSMRTVFPAIRFGSATTTLTTPAGSALAALIGGTSMTFALLDSHNTFSAAHLEVR